MLLLLLSLFASLALAHDCDFPITLNVGDSCSSPWSTLKPFLRPTQFVVGFVSVQIMYSQHFQSKGDAQDYMDQKVVPVVLGPQRSPFLLDHHHTLSALDLAGHDSVKVTLLISCDFSSLSEEDFWTEMQRHQYAFLLTHPPDLPNVLYQQANYSSLPLTVVFTEDGSTFMDDPWRTLSSMVQDVEDDSCPNDDKKCQRGYIKACNSNNGSIPYIEFRWAYFMNLGTVFNTSLWDSQDEFTLFQAAFSRLPTPAWPKYVDMSDWEKAADAIVPLCRSVAAGQYTLPPVFGAALQGTILPGYVPKGTEMPADPNCNLPLCSAAAPRPNPFYTPTQLSNKQLPTTLALIPAL